MAILFCPARSLTSGQIGRSPKMGLPHLRLFSDASVAGTVTTSARALGALRVYPECWGIIVGSVSTGGKFWYRTDRLLHKVYASLSVDVLQHMARGARGPCLWWDLGVWERQG